MSAMGAGTGFCGSSAAVSIIVPTLASADRHLQLLDAVRSIQASSDAPVDIIVCVNGNRWDPECILALERMAGVALHRLPEPSLPKALAHGRAVVATEFFGFLDDDDQLLPGAIDVRMRVLRERPEFDLAVINGIRRTATGDAVVLSNLNRVPADPLRTLFVQNWLPSCGGLFRTATIEQAYFDEYHEYAEWTWLAYRLALDGKRVAVIDEPGFIINDTPGSLSKSTDYHNAYLALYLRMLERAPPSVRKILRRRMADAFHDLSCQCLDRGAIADATRLHLRSLGLPGGLRYASYTRYLIRGFFKTLVRS